jgi:CDP-paratose 2-epimerase
MHIKITGGAGFIGCNLARHYLMQGHTVTVFDNLSRKGSDKNLAWLEQNHGTSLRFIKGDVRDYAALVEAIVGADLVFHMASQVAVTTSVVDPRTDFEINALGTFNVLEAVRVAAPQAVVFYASTNKVYGGMEELAGHPIQVKYGDWRPGDQPVYISDISRAQHELGWTPQIGFREGIARLWRWVRENPALF